MTRGTDRSPGAQVNHAPGYALESINEIGVLEVGKVNAPARGALAGHQDVQMTLCPTAVEGGDDVQHPADDRNLFAHRQRSPPPRVPSPKCCVERIGAGRDILASILAKPRHRPPAIIPPPDSDRRPAAAGALIAA